jgi:hypothetical protein
MDTGEFLTRASVWVSIAAYTLGCIAFAIRRTSVNIDLWARNLWTIACSAMVAHYILAYHFFHHWSHDSAYVETARQTDEVFRINWGGGLFINYALLALWIVDVAWWWFRGLESYRQRPWPLVLLWHSFLIFIILNATVVFKDGMQRWIGAAITLTLIVSWWTIARRRTVVA